MKLSANSRHSVTIKYDKPCAPYVLTYAGTFAKPAWKWKKGGAEYWKTNPGIKINVNNSAKIK